MQATETHWTCAIPALSNRVGLHRRSMLENLPLHRDILAAWEEQGV